MIDEPVFLRNSDWYFYDAKEKRYKLTDKAPSDAVRSYKEFYQTINKERERYMLI